MKVLVLTVGLPRSGKSVWSQRQGVPVVNPDAVRMAIHGRAFLPQAEKLVWAHAEVMVRALFGAGHPCVILDATNVTRKRRAAWLSTEWLTAYAPFADASREKCVVRAEDMGRDDLVPVIDRMAKDYEPLDVIEMQHAIDTSGSLADWFLKIGWMPG